MRVTLEKADLVKLLGKALGYPTLSEEDVDVQAEPFEVHSPEGTGKYNAGQKLMFWSMVPIIAVLCLTGIALWQPWFAPSFSAGVRRTAGLLHAICAFIMFVGIGIHWYAVPGLGTSGFTLATIRPIAPRPRARDRSARRCAAARPSECRRRCPSRSA